MCMRECARPMQKSFDAKQILYIFIVESLSIQAQFDARIECERRDFNRDHHKIHSYIFTFITNSHQNWLTNYRLLWNERKEKIILCTFVNISDFFIFRRREKNTSFRVRVKIPAADFRKLVIIVFCLWDFILFSVIKFKNTQWVQFSNNLRWTWCIYFSGSWWRKKKTLLQIVVCCERP